MEVAVVSAAIQDVAWDALLGAARRVSDDHRFAYGTANLYYQLVRDGVVDADAGAPREHLPTLATHLRELEATRGRLRGRLDTDELMTRYNDRAASARDVWTYAVRRVIVFDRPSPCLTFVANRFFTQIECALVATPGFPASVWERLYQQLDNGLEMTFFAVHDADMAGMAMPQHLRASLAKYPHATVVDCGLTFRQAFRLGMTVGRRAKRRLQPGLDVSPEDTLLLRSGSYAHFEELTPFFMMRTTYQSVCHAFEEIGFG